MFLQQIMETVLVDSQCHNRTETENIVFVSQTETINAGLLVLPGRLKKLYFGPFRHPSRRKAMYLNVFYSYIWRGVWQEKNYIFIWRKIESICPAAPANCPFTDFSQ